jgi:hypothetical protein
LCAFWYSIVLDVGGDKNDLFQKVSRSESCCFDAFAGTIGIEVHYHTIGFFVMARDIACLAFAANG